ncbi:hypothetical protein AU106_gp011 [Sinorhizobium phage phiM9]|uniref:Uncharacterized protein n=1 Tax=Sinorhizobium phage phiM9 TaxID=1636182 RepID=A0A0F6R4U4_9CAUD|nr:hypothetical protein AU106_gp011 [Sinorhizobium phage phiM9]AKE44642.1 hypothetical protein Sm_phiM9_012 [Sinorhizobium phage phiM9]
MLCEILTKRLTIMTRLCHPQVAIEEVLGLERVVDQLSIGNESRKAVLLDFFTFVSDVSLHLSKLEVRVPLGHPVIEFFVSHRPLVHGDSVDDEERPPVVHVAVQQVRHHVRTRVRDVDVVDVREVRESFRFEDDLPSQVFESECLSVELERRGRILLKEHQLELLICSSVLRVWMLISVNAMLNLMNAGLPSERKRGAPAAE